MNAINVNRWRFPAIAAGLLVTLWTATALEWGRHANFYVHDILIETGWLSATQEKAPLLVSVDRTDTDRQTLLKTLANLHSLGASQLVVLPELSGHMASRRMLSLLEPLGFFDQLHWTIRPADTVEQTSVASPQLPAAVTIIPPPVFSMGYFRFIDTPAMENEPLFSKLPALEGSPSLPAINFLLMANGLPEVSARQVAGNQLIPDLVAGTTVLIELSSAGTSPGYPVPGQHTVLNDLQIQGLIWSTLANDAAIIPFPAWVSLVLVGLLFVFNLAALQWLPPVQGAAFSVFIALLLVAAAALTLQFGFRLFPLAELLSTQVVALAFVFQVQRNNEDQAVASMLAETNSLLSERYVPASFIQSDNPWSKIVVLINQQLNLERSILLEKVPRDHRVQEIQALNCNLDSIAEQRRDYQRTPYSTAIELGGPHQLDRPYFKEVEPGELEYLVPLQFASEVIGFWALTVQPQANWNQKAFENNVTNFAGQIAELLFHRDQWHQEQKKNSHLGIRLIKLEGGHYNHRQLQNTLRLLEKRLDEMEDVFAGLGSAALLYDLFGQIKQTNQRLEFLARETGIALYSMTAAELLCEVCNTDLDGARRELRHVTLKQEAIYLPVKAISQQYSYMLHVRPIRSSAVNMGNLDAGGNMEPFELGGILFEFIDISSTHELLAARDDILAEFSSGIRPILNRATEATDHLKKMTTGNPDASNQLSAIADAISQSGSMMDTMLKISYNNATLHKDSKAMDVVNPQRLMQNTLALATEKLQARRLRIIENWPTGVSLALADNHRLKKLLRELLAVLIDDATPDSTITLSVERLNHSGKTEVVITLSNQGYGLPMSTLEELMARPTSLLIGSQDQLEHLIGSFQNLAYWGGAYTAESNLGQGFRFSLRLLGVELNSLEEVSSRLDPFRRPTDG